MIWGLAEAYQALFNTIPEREKAFEIERECLRGERESLRGTLYDERVSKPRRRISGPSKSLLVERKDLQSE